MATAEVAASPRQGTYAPSLDTFPLLHPAPIMPSLASRLLRFIPQRHADQATSDRPKRKPFAQLIRNWTNRKSKGSNDQANSGSKQKDAPGSKNKRHFGYGGSLKNNPYPQSGHHLQQRQQSLESSANDNLSMSVASRRRDGDSSFDSARHDADAPAPSNKSGAPTLATNAGTIHTDAGYSRAATTTTRGGALSSLDGANADSNFSSPRNSQHSLTTTLTTIHSTGTTLQNASAGSHQNNHGLNSTSPAVMFSHQYPVSPAPSATGTHISAIPRHLTDGNQSAANANLLTDNASILTLASSSKRRRRSMDTDASVRALAPSSVYGGSRESLPLSVLSGNVDRTDATSTSGVHFSQSRPSIGGIASAERASVYSMQGGGGGTLASERNSYYSYRPNKDLGDAKSLRSITGLDSRSLAGDARSINADAKSLGGGDARSLGGDVASLKTPRGDDGSIRSGAVGHSRNDSIPGSIGAHSLIGQSSHQNRLGALSRRSSDWAEADGEGEFKPSLDEQREKDGAEKMESA